MDDNDLIEQSIDVTIDEQWRSLGSPGTWLTGDERIAVARLARTDAADPDRAEPLPDAAHRVAHHASTLRLADVDSWEAAGLDRLTYVEIVGIASRVAAIDTYERGLGRAPRPLPDPVDGPPTRRTAPAAKRRAGWVPAVGAIGPPTALTAVPDEADAQERLHTALYLSYAGMADLDAASGLHRTQMELVAARVSFLNDCFF